MTKAFLKVILTLAAFAVITSTSYAGSCKKSKANTTPVNQVAQATVAEESPLPGCCATKVTEVAQAEKGCCADKEVKCDKCKEKAAAEKGCCADKEVKCDKCKEKAAAKKGCCADKEVKCDKCKEKAAKG